MINLKRLRAILSGGKRKVRGIKPDKGLELRYAKTLVGIVREIGAFNLEFVKRLESAGMIADAPLDYDSVFNARFSRRFDELSKAYPEKYLGQADASHKKAFIAEVNAKIGINLTDMLKDKTSRVGRVIEHRTKENTDLIKSLVGDYKEQAREAIHQTLLQGDTTTTLRAALEHIEGVSESRAKLIARDQTQKICGELNKARQQDVGVTHYIWSGIDDGRERDTHIENNGKRFAWDAPPEETGHPGEDVQCRCTADPDLEGFLQTLQEDTEEPAE